MIKDRRYDSRVKLTRPITILLSNGNKVNAYISDISEHGLGILTLAPADIGAKLTFMFELPIAKKLHSFKLRGVIRHSHLRTNKHASGVLFQKINENDAALIKDFIAEIRGKRALKLKH